MSWWSVALLFGLAVTTADAPLGGRLVHPAVPNTAFAQDARSDTTLRPLDLKEYREMIAAHHGQIVIVDFWATWCSPCREEMPALVALAAEHKTDGVQLVTVSADMTEQGREAGQFLDSVGAPAARYIKQADDDDRFIQSVDSGWTGALPAVFVYDREGRKVRAFFGETSADSVALVLREARAP